MAAALPWSFYAENGTRTSRQVQSSNSRSPLSRQPRRKLFTQDQDYLEEGIAETATAPDAGVNDLLAQVRQIVERERFLHWELAFPTVQTAGNLEDGGPGEGPGAPRQSLAGAGPAVDPDRLRELGARRYDVFGTANFFNFTAWTAALDLVLDHGVESVAAHDQALVERLIAGLDKTRFELTSPREGRERSTLVFLTHRRPEENRAVHRRLQEAGVHCALRRGRLRLSPHLHNTPDDVDRALEVLHR